MQIEAMDTEPLADLRCFRGRRQKHFAAFRIGQPALEIAIHDGEGGTGFFQRLEVPGGPVPEADAEAHLLQATRTPFDWFVAPEHFGTSGKLEAHLRFPEV